MKYRFLTLERLLKIYIEDGTKTKSKTNIEDGTYRLLEEETNYILTTLVTDYVEEKKRIEK